MWEEQLALYDRIIDTHPEIERKGKSMPHTATNTYMFSMLNKAGEIGMRLPKEQREQLMEEHHTTEYKSYGAVIKDYILIPTSLYDQIDVLASLLHDSFEYTKSLKPQPRKNNRS